MLLPHHSCSQVLCNSAPPSTSAMLTSSISTFNRSDSSFMNYLSVDLVLDFTWALGFSVVSGKPRTSFSFLNSIS
jgi:hypothetical protein